MKAAHFVFLLALAGCARAEETRYAAELISFEPSVFQSEDKLAASWKAIDQDRSDIIHRYLFALGVSSTGVIQLIGAYGTDGSGALLQFQQIDLYGTRLVWSVLVDPDAMSARVIYHTQHDRISEGFVPISVGSADQ